MNVTDRPTLELANLVELRWGPRAGFWWPKDQLDQRVRTISSTLLLKVLAIGADVGAANPPELLQLLKRELRRRVSAGEPVTITADVERWIQEGGC